MTLGPLSPGKYWGMRRLADASGRFTMLAVDQRPPIKAAVARARGEAEARDTDVRAVKRLLIEQLSPQATALLADPHWALATALEIADPRAGLVVTLEDSQFEESDEGRISRAIPHWSVEQIKRSGGDAVKVLLWYRPDAPASVCEGQQAWAEEIGEQCKRYDIPFLLELLLYPFAQEAGATTAYIESPSKRPELVVESVRTFADPRFGVDLFKLESPLPAAQLPAEPSSETLHWFEALNEAAARPWVLLSAGVSAPEFARVLTHAYAAGASGFLAGRAIWAEALHHWPDAPRFAAHLAGPSRATFERFIRITKTAALPWFAHPGYGSGGAQLVGHDAAMEMQMEPQMARSIP